MMNKSYYLGLSKIYALKGNCKKRIYGCVIVSPGGNIVSVGYTHSKVPCDKCKRRFARRGHGYEKCTSIHAEQEAVAGYNIPYGSTAYLTCFDTKTKKEVPNPHPCATCERLLHSAGVRKVVTLTEEFEV